MGLFSSKIEENVSLEREKIIDDLINSLDDPRKEEEEKEKAFGKLEELLSRLAYVSFTKWSLLFESSNIEEVIEKSIDLTCEFTLLISKAVLSSSKLTKEMEKTLPTVEFITKAETFLRSKDLTVLTFKETYGTFFVRNVHFLDNFRTTFPQQYEYTYFMAQINLILSCHFADFIETEIDEKTKQRTVRALSREFHIWSDKKNRMKEKLKEQPFPIENCGKRKSKMKC